MPLKYIVIVFKKMMLLHRQAGIWQPNYLSRIPVRVQGETKLCFWKAAGLGRVLQPRDSGAGQTWVRTGSCGRACAQRCGQEGACQSPGSRGAVPGGTQGPSRALPASLFLWACSCFWSGRQKPNRRRLLLIFQYQIPYSWIRTCRFGYHFHR